MIVEAIKAAGFVPGEDVYLAIDVASSELYKDGIYHLAGEGVDRTASEMVDFYEAMLDKYPIISIEDGLYEDDWEGWKEMTERIGKRVQLVGDDLFVTNTRRLSRGINNDVANSILIKVNQIGTLTETLEPSKWQKKPAIPPLFLTVPAKPKTPPSQTSLLRPTLVRSKLARHPAPIVWQIQPAPAY